MNPRLHDPARRWRAASLAMLLASGCASGLVERRTPETGGPYAPAPAAFRAATLELGERLPPALRTPNVRLAFATTRRRTPGGFGSEPDGAMHLGQVTMSIGPAGTTWEDLVDWTRLNENQLPPVRVSLGALDHDGCAGLGWGDAAPDARFLAGLEPLYAHGGRRVLLFVHGGETSFAEAAATLACLHQHQGRRGAPVLFSWSDDVGGPLRASDRGHGSANALARLATLLSGPGRVERIDCVVSSSGAALVVDALRQLEASLGRAGLAQLRLGTLVLALPDVVLDEFTGADVALVAAACRRTVVYSDRRNQLLGIAGSWRETAPSGIEPAMREDLEAQRARVELVDVTDLAGPRHRDGLSRHGAWYRNPLLLTDALLALLLGDPAAERGLVQVPGDLVWTLPPDYSKRITVWLARRLDEEAR
jgi:esterase/lipase superfamily enzyme